MQKTMRQGLKERQDTPLVLTTSEEPFNSASRCISPHKGVSYSKSLFSVRSGCNPSKKGRIVRKHNVFVLGLDEKPLTPTTNAKARKLMESNQAKAVWNKFGQFGIQMLVETRKEVPRTVLGCDFGTKFEGYSVITDKENNLSVMWKLPDKKKLVRKLKERRTLRRARRFRNCRRRECRSNNRNKDGFIAPSQLMMVNSRLKCIKELFKCYPIDTTAVEDIRFNHRDKKWGKNFSTMEIGKRKIYDYLRSMSMLQMYSGVDTFDLRGKYGYKKTSKKDAEVFNSHCSDAMTIAVDTTVKEYVSCGKFIVVDDTYRSVRRKLHDSQYSKGGVRDKYSCGNFKGIRKGSMCEFGQMAGGTKSYAYIYNWDGKRIGKSLKKVAWLSHKFKIKEDISPPLNKLGGLRNVEVL